MKPSPGQLPLEQPAPFPMAAFDLEIAKELPDNESWERYRPFGISCAAIALESGPVDLDVEFYTDGGSDVAGRFLRRLEEVAKTHHIVSFNGLGFDFDVLAEETGEVERCARLAIDHIDLIQLIVVTKGYYKALDAVCEGMGIEGKVHSVVLNDGSILESMGGGEAPRLWKAGERNAVLAYLRGDVVATLELAREARRREGLQWMSGSGRRMSVSIPRLLTVRECLEARMPYQGFLSQPWPSPAASFEWAKGVDYGQA